MARSDEEEVEEESDWDADDDDHHFPSSSPKAAASPTVAASPQAASSPIVASSPRARDSPQASISNAIPVDDAFEDQAAVGGVLTENADTYAAGGDEASISDAIPDCDAPEDQSDVGQALTENADADAAGADEVPRYESRGDEEELEAKSPNGACLEGDGDADSGDAGSDWDSESVGEGASKEEGEVRSEHSPKAESTTEAMEEVEETLLKECDIEGDIERLAADEAIRVKTSAKRGVAESSHHKEMSAEDSEKAAGAEKASWNEAIAKRHDITGELRSDKQESSRMSSFDNQEHNEGVSDKVENTFQVGVDMEECVGSAASSQRRGEERRFCDASLEVEENYHDGTPHYHEDRKSERSSEPVEDEASKEEDAAPMRHPRDAEPATERMEEVEEACKDVDDAHKVVADADLIDKVEKKTKECQGSAGSEDKNTKRRVVHDDLQEDNHEGVPDEDEDAGSAWDSDPGECSASKKEGEAASQNSHEAEQTIEVREEAEEASKEIADTDALVADEGIVVRALAENASAGMVHAEMASNDSSKALVAKKIDGEKAVPARHGIVDEARLDGQEESSRPKSPERQAHADESPHEKVRSNFEETEEFGGSAALNRNNTDRSGFHDDRPHSNDEEVAGDDEDGESAWDSESAEDGAGKKEGETASQRSREVVGTIEVRKDMKEASKEGPYDDKFVADEVAIDKAFANGNKVRTTEEAEMDRNISSTTISAIRVVGDEVPDARPHVVKKMSCEGQESSPPKCLDRQAHSEEQAEKKVMKKPQACGASADSPRKITEASGLRDEFPDEDKQHHGEMPGEDEEPKAARDSDLGAEQDATEGGAGATAVDDEAQATPAKAGRPRPPCLDAFTPTHRGSSCRSEPILAKRDAGDADCHNGAVVEQVLDLAPAASASAEGRCMESPSPPLPPPPPLPPSPLQPITPLPPPPPQPPCPPMPPEIELLDGCQLRISWSPPPQSLTDDSNTDSTPRSEKARTSNAACTPSSRTIVVGYAVLIDDGVLNYFDPRSGSLLRNRTSIPPIPATTYSIIIGGVAVGATYTAAVAALGPEGAGWGPYSNCSKPVVVDVPPAPSQPPALEPLDATSIRVTWAPISTPCILGYGIMFAEVADDDLCGHEKDKKLLYYDAASCTLVDTPMDARIVPAVAASTVVRMLSVGMRYRARLTALNNVGWSRYSPPSLVVAIVAPPTPSPPLVSVVSCASVRVSWAATAHAPPISGYALALADVSERTPARSPLQFYDAVSKTLVKNPDLANPVCGDACDAMVFQLRVGATYKAVLASRNDAGWSRYSSSSEPFSLAVPKAPKQPRVEVLDGSTVRVVLEVGEDSSATGCALVLHLRELGRASGGKMLYYDAASGALREDPLDLCPFSPTTASVDIGHIPHGFACGVKVAVRNNVGWSQYSPFSQRVSITVPPAPERPPVARAVSADAMRVSWWPVMHSPEVSAYVLVTSASNGSDVAPKTIVPCDTLSTGEEALLSPLQRPCSAVISGLAPGVSYQFSVASENSVGRSHFSGPSAVAMIRNPQIFTEGCWFCGSSPSLRVDLQPFAPCPRTLRSSRYHAVMDGDFGGRVEVMGSVGGSLVDIALRGATVAADGCSCCLAARLSAASFRSRLERLTKPPSASDQCGLLEDDVALLFDSREGNSMQPAGVVVELNRVLLEDMEVHLRDWAPILHALKAWIYNPKHKISSGMKVWRGSKLTVEQALNLRVGELICSPMVLTAVATRELAEVFSDHYVVELYVPTQCACAGVCNRTAAEGGDLFLLLPYTPLRVVQSLAGDCREIRVEVLPVDAQLEDVGGQLLSSDCVRVVPI